MGSTSHAQPTISAVSPPFTAINIELFIAAKSGLSFFTNSFSRVPDQQKPDILGQTTSLGNTFLHVAATSGHHDLAQFLIRSSPDLIGRKNHHGDTPLHVAARLGHLQVVEILLDSNNYDLESNNSSVVFVNKLGNTALHEALIHNREHIIDYFLTKGDFWEIRAFRVNNDGKSPVYLAVEKGDLPNLKIMLSKIASTNRILFDECIKEGKSVIHAAILRKNLALLQVLAETEPSLFNGNDEPLHFAASVGFLDGVKYLLPIFSMDVFKIGADGLCPIHLASKNGHVNIIGELLSHYPDASEFLSEGGHNILHIAAESGKNNVVKYILKECDAEMLLNEKDNNGNTPLHLATREWHPKVVNHLLWDGRVQLGLVNDEGLTALEVAEKYMEIMAPFRKRLTWMALRSAGTPRAQLQDEITVKRLQAAKYEPYNMEYCKDRVNTLLLVSALVATVTFAAGFTMPGGYNSSDSSAQKKNPNSNPGMATMIHKQRFQAFVIFDSLAMYSSIFVAVILMWAQLGDLNLLLNALRSAQRLLGFSLTMMSIAFMAGADLVVMELNWLADIIFIMGIISLAILLALFVPLFLPYTSHLSIARYISYYPFKLLMLASES